MPIVLQIGFLERSNVVLLELSELFDIYVVMPIHVQVHLMCACHILEERG